MTYRNSASTAPEKSTIASPLTRVNLESTESISTFIICARCSTSSRSRSSLPHSSLTCAFDLRFHSVVISTHVVFLFFVCFAQSTRNVSRFACACVQFVRPIGRVSSVALAAEATALDGRTERRRWRRRWRQWRLATIDRQLEQRPHDDDRLE